MHCAARIWLVSGQGNLQEEGVAKSSLLIFAGKSERPEDRLHILGLCFLSKSGDWSLFLYAESAVVGVCD
jgi:hypothetical protein